MYISVDMGGTNTRLAGVHNLKHLDLYDDPIRRRNTQSYENDLEFIIKTAKRIAGRQAIHAVGIGTPGTPNPDHTHILSATNMRHWEHRPLVKPLAEALDCPVYYDNDGVTAGLGEAYYGNTPTDFHYLIWGTGIGGAAIKRTAEGDVAHAAKLHWQSHFRDWEQACGGGKLEMRYGKPPYSDTQWQQVHRDFGGHLLRYWEQFTPRAIVFGGGLASKQRAFLERAWLYSGVEVGVSDFEDDSGIIGGFGLIRYEHDYPNRLPEPNSNDIEE